MLEVRNTSNNELVPVDMICIETSMKMQGNPPTIRIGSALSGDVPERYVIGSDFAARPNIGDDVTSLSARRVAGQWELVVMLHPNQRIEFTAIVE